jgi:hypothetical protein
VTDELKMGIYEHYKGPLYLVLGIGHDANAGELYAHRNDVARSSSRAPSGERIVVIYIGLQLGGAHLGPRLAVRTLEDFLASVCIQPEHRHYGKVAGADDPCRTVQRFTYLGSELEASMVAGR